MPRKLVKPDEIKIFILYLMEKLGYPLDFDSICAIVIQDGVVNYFDFAQCFGELEDAGHVEKTENDVDSGAALYRVTDKGRAVARSLNSVIALSIKEKSYRSALRHMSLAKRGAVVDQKVIYDAGGALFNGIIKDPNGLQLEFTIRAESETHLERMRKTFIDRPEVVLRGLTALLTGDLDFVFGTGEE